jgi:hypothetical protein
LHTKELLYPGKSRPGLTDYTHGIQTLSTELDLATRTMPATIGVLQGYLPVVVATASKPVEFAIDNGVVADQTPREIGDWRITASKSRELTKPDYVGGTQPPDHAFTLTIERLKDAAPPLPLQIAAITTFEGEGAQVENSAEKDPKTRQWTVNMFTRDIKKPVTKMIVDVPTNAKEAVLPFEFKNVVAQPSGR